MPSLEDLVWQLDLKPHPVEGGWFVETYRSDESFTSAAGVRRSLSTAIYYLLTPDSVSALHRLRGDEIFHFYLGDPVEMLQLRPDGGGRIITIGTDFGAGMRPQVVVPAGVWQGSRLAPGGRFALLGTTMAPGFDPTDYERPDAERLLASYPDFTEMIRELAR